MNSEVFEGSKPLHCVHGLLYCYDHDVSNLPDEADRFILH